MAYNLEPTEFSSLEEAKKVAQVCLRCDLSLTRTLVAFGEGAQDAKLMLIGEGPGEDEDLQGRPFVGRAGALLNRWLESIGIARSDVWITNIVRCRPCSLVENQLTNRQPRVPEINACKIYMDAELSFVKPDLILCLGAVAAKLFTYKGFKITTERGKWFDGPQGSLVTATYHPAYVLRQQGEDRTRMQAQVDSDLAKIRDKYFLQAA